MTKHPGARTGVSRSCTEALHRRHAVLWACLALAMPVQAAAPVAEKDSSGLGTRVERLERLMQNQGLVDLLQQVQALQQEVNRLRGEVDVQAHTIGQMKERERALHADMDRRLQALESGGAAADSAAAGVEDTATPVPAEPPLEPLAGVSPDTDVTAGTEADSALTVETLAAPVAVAAGAAAAGTALVTGAAADSGAEVATGLAPAAAGAAGAAATGTAIAALPAATDTDAASGNSDQADYDRAFWLLKQARYEEAITAFRNYRAAWPRGRNADNAQYWLGEGYHATRNYAQALIEYERLVKEFPDSQKITHAMLKSGYCLQELGRTDEARARLRDLVTRYPGTTAARLAEERLRTLAAATAP